MLIKKYALNKHVHLLTTLYSNYHLGQLFWPVSQIDVQRIMLGFLMEGHIIIMYAQGDHSHS